MALHLWEQWVSSRCECALLRAGPFIRAAHPTPPPFLADGFFFDLSVADYDSDCDGDPFANGYLTEDEMEWPEDYKPDPPVPRRVVDQIYFLSTVRGYPVQRLATKYRISTERVCAIISLKRSEPEMIATGRYDPAADELLQQLYYGAAAKTSDNWAPDYDLGVNFNIMQDDQMPDDVYPVRRRGGNVLREGHKLPKLPTPPRAQRPLKSKFVFRDVSGSSSSRNNTYVMSGWDGTRRPATNTESLYRSWQNRHWSLAVSKGKVGMPFEDGDGDKPANFRLPP